MPSYARSGSYLFQPTSPIRRNGIGDQNGTVSSGAVPRERYVYYHRAASALCSIADAQRESLLGSIRSHDEHMQHVYQVNKSIAARGFYVDPNSYSQCYGMGKVRLAQIQMNKFIQMIYNGLHWKLEKYQLLLAKAYIKATLRLMTEDAFPILENEYRRELGVGKFLHSFVVTSSTRRSGKTIALAVLILATVICRPGTVINIISNCRAGAENIKEMILEILDAMGASDLVDGRARKAAVIRFKPMFKNAPSSKIRFLSSNATISTPSSLLAGRCISSAPLPCTSLAILRWLFCIW